MKHLVELSDEEIMHLAEALQSNTAIADHCAYIQGHDYLADEVRDKRLCDRLEALLPPEAPRQTIYWSKEAHEAGL